MRPLHFVILLLALAAASAAQMPPVPPPPRCAAQSAWVNATAPVTAGEVFTATALYPNATKCSCVVRIPENSDPIYGATTSYVITDEGCVCTCIATADTPAGVLSFRACAFA